MKVLVGLSGGVDSAVSALLLQRAGHEVAGGFMINYLEETPQPSFALPSVALTGGLETGFPLTGGHTRTCPTKIDLEEARRVAEFLQIPFYTFDYRDEYESRIISYIYSEYAKGRTPNPDVFCNNLVKFDLFLEEALSLGYDAIATGHYAKILDSRLMKGIDPEKDQSYFLSRLSPFQLSKAIFPIGGLTKSEVRTIAREAGLPNAERKDSQGLCFIGKVSMSEFLARRIESHPGDIITSDGQKIGTHQGVEKYTIGQRKGIEIGGGPALYVIQKDIRTNTLTVGTSNELALYNSRLIATDWVGINGQLTIDNGQLSAKIRYRQEDQEISSFQFLDSDRVEIHFSTPQRAIASGQIIVIYDGDLVVGSGIIE